MKFRWLKRGFLLVYTIGIMDVIIVNQELIKMALPKVYEGTWEELSTHANEFKEYPRLTLIVPPQETPAPGLYRADLTPEERIRMLDALAERNRHLPVLPDAAFERESLYADDEELR